MRKIIHRGWLLLLVALVLVNLVGAVAFGAEEKIKLHYLTWATGASMDWIREDLIEPFQKLHPNIEIEHEAVSFGQFQDKLMVYTASGNPPDLMHVSAGWVYEHAQQGLLRDLQPFFNRDLKASDFFLEPMKAVRYPSTTTGDLYAMPFSIMETAFFYNKTMFDNSGLAYPGKEFTWFDVRDMGKKLASDTNGDGKKDVWGFYSTYDYQNLDPMIHAFGGRVLDDQFNVRLTEEPAMQAARFLTDLIFKDGVSPQHGSGVSSALFTNGKMGMLVGTTPNVADYRAKATFDWDSAMMPKGPSKRVVRVWPDSFGIHAQSKHAEAAWEYIKFVVTQTKVDRYTGDRKLPIYRPLALSKDWLQADQKPNKRTFIEQVAYSDPLEWRPRWTEWDGAKAKALAPAWRGEMAIETAMLQAARTIESIIKPALGK